MAENMVGNLRKAKKMDKVTILGQMEEIILDHLKMDYQMVKGLKPLPMVGNI